MDQQMGYLERIVRCRRAMIAGMAVLLVAWTALLPVSPIIARDSTVSYPVWCVLACVYVLDRKVRGQVVYAGVLASWAYFLVHDIPLLIQPTLYVGPVGWTVMLLSTGFLAGLANGRRCAGIAALAGALLAGLWTLQHAATGALDYRLVYRAHEHLVRSLPMIVLGGLLADAVLSLRRRSEAPRPGHAVLWALILGLTVPQLTQTLVRLAAPAPRTGVVQAPVRIR